MALSATAGALTIARDVIGIDVSLTQNTPGKVPLAAILRPPPPAARYEPPAPVFTQRDVLTMPPVPNPR